MARIVKAVSFALFSSFFIGGVALAQTVNANSCSASDVQNALNSVTAATTTVNIPSGTCTWSTQVAFTVPSGNTSLTIQGQTACTGSGDPYGSTSGVVSCTDSTAITDGYGSGMLQITGVPSSSLLRITGLTFAGGSSLSGVTPMISITGASQSATLRIDHTHMNLSTFSSGGNVGYEVYTVQGVMDHNLCDDNQGIGECIQVEAPAYGGASWGDGSWNAPDNFGTSDAFYIEDNQFSQGWYIGDCHEGGRQVIRFNSFNNNRWQTHPTGAAGRYRGCRKTEAYGNQYNGSTACNGTSGYGNCATYFAWLSSGAALIWGNNAPVVNSTTESGYNYVVWLESMRVSNTTYSETASPNGWGYCGTAQSGSLSNWDQNSNITTGYHCLDQPGMGMGDLLSGNFPKACDQTKGCSTYSGSWPNEALSPIYEWENTFTPVSDNPTATANLNQSQFVDNTDYYLWCNSSPQNHSGCSSFNGTAGVGSGPLASSPSTCTTGVAYFGTDQGSWNQSGNGFGSGVLYQCSATNTWTTYYSPYTYPHPLTQATGNLTPPTNVSAVGH